MLVKIPYRDVPKVTVGRRNLAFRITHFVGAPILPTERHQARNAVFQIEAQVLVIPPTFAVLLYRMACSHQQPVIGESHQRASGVLTWFPIVMCDDGDGMAANEFGHL